MPGDRDTSKSDAPHSPKKKTHYNSNGGMKTCPSLDDSANFAGHKDHHGGDKESTTQEDASDAGSYAEYEDDIVVVDSDDDEDSDYNDDESSAAEEEEAAPVVTTAPAPDPIIDFEEINRRGFAAPSSRPGVVRGYSFEDESFPAPPKGDDKVPRRQVTRQISVEDLEGKVVLCTPADKHRTKPRRYNGGSPSSDDDQKRVSLSSTGSASSENSDEQPKTPTSVPKQRATKSSPTRTSVAAMTAKLASPTQASPATSPARLVPKPLPPHVASDDVNEKIIQWEKPEWAKKTARSTLKPASPRSSPKATTRASVMSRVSVVGESAARPKAPGVADAADDAVAQPQWVSKRTSLKPINLETSPTKQLGWEKPDWAKKNQQQRS